jgi:hypothetical protein
MNVLEIAVKKVRNEADNEDLDDAAGVELL